jgi:hypothetical protein
VNPARYKIDDTTITTIEWAAIKTQIRRTILRVERAAGVLDSRASRGARRFRVSMNDEND